jgi:hypothetical protein
MADAPKKRRASGPRVAKPVFAVVSYTDADGSLVQLDKNRLSISIERDAGKLLELVTGEGAQVSCVTKINLPQPQKRNTAGAEGAATAA